MKAYSAIIFLLLLGGQSLYAQVNARLFQYPDVSDTHITFSYGGDIWVVEKAGGTAYKLTSAPGEEMFPRFSPDGARIAFSGNYSGNVDVYVMPTLGGLPNRITHHGMPDRVLDWYPDGQHLLFASSRESGKQRFSQFYKVAAEGGMPEKLVVPYGEFGMLSPDGNKIAYTPISRAFRTWKRYRGGMAADIWIFDLDNITAENITNNTANDEFPMWVGNKVYFLSDGGSNQRFNIWSYDISSKQTKQITDFSDFDIHFPSIGTNEIVFEAGGLLYLLDLSTEQYKEVPINVTTDVAALMPRQVNVKDMTQYGYVSYDGKRAVFEARGELFSVPAENGPVLNLTQSSGSAQRYPAWSPDGRYIAYWSDQSGEYELTLKDMKKPNEEKQLSNYGPGYRYQLFWSPDSKKVAFVDKAMQVYVFDITTNQSIPVDQQTSLFEGGLEDFNISWSPDSRYIAFGKNMDNYSNAVALFDVEAKELHTVTSGFYNDQEPVFDPDGNYLYFFTNRNFDPVYSDFDNSWVYVNSTQIAAVTLNADSIPPTFPQNDSSTVKTEEEQEPDNKEKKRKDKDKQEEKDEKTPKVNITWEGFEDRVVLLPPEAGNYRNLSAVSGKVLYIAAPASGAEGKSPLKYYDLEEREEKTVIGSVRGFMVSANGEKILLNSDGDFGVIEIKPDQKLEKKMPVDQMEMAVIPKEEWRQIFNDAWRFERDFFYDPNMHGVDWEGMKTRYGNLIDDAVTRWDLNFIIGELIAEISASHTYRGGGDLPETPSKAVGYLGIDWGLKEGAYYVKRMVKAAPWDLEERSPLKTSGIDIEEGDYILAVNNVPIDPNKDPWAAFEGLAGETVQLTVNSKPSEAGAHTVLVKTLSDETRLRNLEWIEANRKSVAEATDGKIGYIYVPSTARDGQLELTRMFYSQFTKDGLIIDERFNNGGQIPDRFIELLDRKPLAFWAVRDGRTWQWPPVGNFGPKVMLINGWSGSGGDAFPDYFRKAGLGPLIGTRTWGGLIGISGAPSLIDGGYVTVPTFRMFDPDGKWFKEGVGVSPDIEVKEDPAMLAKGKDPQLERAIQEALRLLKEKPPVRPAVPAYENRN